ncbi:hypothetical protein T439DRAFT_327526 [Meredithblackwellia eburnea MCA 4105]
MSGVNKHENGPASADLENKQPAIPDDQTTAVVDRQPRIAEQKKKSWRASVPSYLLAPIEALFPAASLEGTLPFVASASNRKKWRNRKHIFRASIVSLSCFILILEPASLKTLGNAGFFSVIVSFMLPATLPIMLFFLAMTTMVMGMLLGWAWSCAGMAAALKARDKVLLASQFQRVQASLAGATNPEALYQVAIFKGEFLDARSSVVFGIFLWTGAFFFGLMRAKVPKLTFLAIFGTIVTDVMCSYGPLFPFAEYTLASNFLLPTSCYIAIALGGTILIFPESLNRSWTTDLVDTFLIPLLERSQLHSKALSTTPPTDKESAEAWTTLSGKFLASGAQASGGLEALLGSVGMTELEISKGRFGAKDLIGLTELLRELFARSMGLGVFCNQVASVHKRVSARELALSETPQEGKPRAVEHRMDRIRRLGREAETTHSHGLANLLPILQRTSSPLRTACDEALLATMEWLTDTNSNRWIGHPNPEAVEAAFQAQAQRIVKLEEALINFRTSGRSELCAPFKDFFDAITGELIEDPSRSEHTPARLSFSPASLFLCFAASSNLIWYAEALIKFEKHIHDLEGKRRVNKLWFPTGMRKIGKILKGGRSAGVAAGESPNGNPDEVESVGATDDHDEEVKKVEEQKDVKDALGEAQRDPDAKPPKNGLQKLSIKLYAFLKWFSTPEAIFALRYATISVLLWLIAVFPNTAYFAYVNKALWALIMGQTGLAVWAGDQISATVQKAIGTAVGLVYGMLCWYIGSGRGNGNRIGLGAAFYVLMIPVLALRLFGPPQYMQVSIIGGVTSVLIVGYSWIDTHLVSLGNPGVGASIAWRRAVLVLIGMAAATIIMLFPKSVSARHLVRRTHATCIEEIGKIYAAVVGAWLREQQTDEIEDSKALGEDKAEASPFSVATQKQVRARMLALFLKLRGIKMSIGHAGFELSMRGDWPIKEYTSLLEHESAILQALSQVGLSLVHLDAEWRRLLVVRTAFLNPNLIADVTSSFYLISLALRQGSPLPETTPGPLLDRLIYHEQNRRSTRKALQAVESKKDDDVMHDDHSAHHVEGAGIGTNITFQTLEDERFGIYATAILALASVLATVDEMEDVTKELVGEVHFPGFENLRQMRGNDV